MDARTGESWMSVEKDLHGEQVSHLDLSSFITVRIGTRVEEVVRRMREDDRNCVLVTGYDGRLNGIFTERDVLQKVLGNPSSLNVNVEALMTSSPDTVQPGDSIAQALRLMNHGHYRHVPVVDRNGKVVGSLNHNAIIRFLCDRVPAMTYNLSPEPDRMAKSPEGA